MNPKTKPAEKIAVEVVAVAAAVSDGGSGGFVAQSRASRLRRLSEQAGRIAVRAWQSVALADRQRLAELETVIAEKASDGAGFARMLEATREHDKLTRGNVGLSAHAQRRALADRLAERAEREERLADRDARRAANHVEPSELQREIRALLAGAGCDDSFIATVIAATAGRGREALDAIRDCVTRLGNAQRVRSPGAWIRSDLRRQGWL